MPLPACRGCLSSRNRHSSLHDTLTNDHGPAHVATPSPEQQRVHTAQRLARTDWHRLLVGAVPRSLASAVYARDAVVYGARPALTGPIAIRASGGRRANGPLVDPREIVVRIKQHQIGLGS